MPVSSVGTRKFGQYDALDVEPVANRTQPAAKNSAPGKATTRWPKRSESAPPIGADSAAMSGPGVTAKPACRIE